MKEYKCPASADQGTIIQPGIYPKTVACSCETGKKLTEFFGLPQYEVKLEVEKKND